MPRAHRLKLSVARLAESSTASVRGAALTPARARVPERAPIGPTPSRLRTRAQASAQRLLPLGALAAGFGLFNAGVMA